MRGVTLVSAMDMITLNLELVDAFEYPGFIRLTFAKQWQGKCYALDLYSAFDGVDVYYRTCGDIVVGETFGMKEIRKPADMADVVLALKALGVAVRRREVA